MIVADVNVEAGQRAAETAGGSFVRLDVGVPAEWKLLAAELERLEVACLNAGVGTATASVAELTDEEYRRVLRINVDGVVLGVRSLTPLLAPGGRIVVTASLAGLVPLPSDPVYTLTKHAVIGFVRSVAPQLEALGVSIGAVCPGIADTPLLGTAARAELAAADFPLLAPEAVADAVALALADDETGQAWAIQPGRDPVRFRFPNVPGPRSPGGEGARPPLGVDGFVR